MSSLTNLGQGIVVTDYFIKDDIFAISEMPKGNCVISIKLNRYAL